jgi:hypothetical protein
MAYRYNEKTGEFEDIPQGPAQRRNSQPSISDIPSIEELNRVTTRQHTWSNSRVPHVPTRTSTSHISTPPVVTQQPQSTSNDAGFFSTIGAIILNILPYAIGFLIVGTCS